MTARTMNFYPGPSMVHPELSDWVTNAQKDGYLSINHRSEAFSQLYRDIVLCLKKTWQVPSNYSVYFVSSATECWEICYQSLSKQNTLHIYNGNFGEKWYTYASIHRQAKQYVFDINDDPYFFFNSKKSSILPDFYDDLLCLTHTETSNGTALPHSFLEYCRNKYDDAIIAIDATASMGGVSLPYKNGDIWFASVQKCFGLPAGMCIMIVSPRAVERCKSETKETHYNSISNLNYHYQNFQTTHTPNVLNIYLLYEVLKKSGSIDSCHEIIRKKQLEWNLTMERLISKNVCWLVENKSVRAETVHAITYSAERLQELMLKAKKQNIILGNGYGQWQKDTFRVANYPVIPAKYYDLLEDFLMKEG